MQAKWQAITNMDWALWFAVLGPSHRSFVRSVRSFHPDALKGDKS